MKTLLFLLLIQIFSTVVSIDFSFSLALSSSVKKVKTHKLVIIKKNNQEDLDKDQKSSKLSEKSNLETSKPQQKIELKLAADHYADFKEFSRENNLFEKDLCKMNPSLIGYPLNGYDPSQIKLLYSKVNECFFKICDFLMVMLLKEVEILKTFAPKCFSASSKDALVRVLFSKKRFTRVFPRKTWLRSSPLDKDFL